MEKKTTRKSIWIVLILLVISLLGGYFLTSYLANKKTRETNDDASSSDQVHSKDVYGEPKKFESPIFDDEETEAANHEEAEVVNHEETEGEEAAPLVLTQHAQSSEANQDHTSHNATRSK